MKNRLVFNLSILFSMAAVQVSIFLLPAGYYNAYLNIIRPVSYLVLLLITSLFIGYNYGFSKKKNTAFLILAIGAIMFLGVLLAAGIVAGFGYNAEMQTADKFLTNLWRFVPFVICSEIIRWQLMQNVGKKYKLLMSFLVVFVFTFVMIENLNLIINSNQFIQVNFILTTLFPLLVVNFFLTYVCQSGSLKGMLLFRGFYSFLLIFMPILPKVENIFFAIVTYTVIFIMFIMYDKYVYEENASKERKKRKPYGWKRFIAPFALLFVFIVFGFGLLPVAPVAVGSKSMESEEGFNMGDMLVIQKLGSPDEVIKNVKVGDVIQFVSGNVSIVHRVVDIFELKNTGEKTEVLYITKGDANTSVDATPVNPSNIVGKVMYKIPYMGYPAVWLTNMINV